MDTLVLKKGKERSLLRRHPWIYDTAMAGVQGSPRAGDTVRVVDAAGRFLALAAYAPESGIRARCWTFEEATPVDEAFVAERLRRALAARRRLAARTNAVREVFGEADGLPGLIVDRYAAFYVTQFLSCGAERFRQTILRTLAEQEGIEGVYDRSDAATRAREGLAPASGTAFGKEPPERIDVVENGVRYAVDVRNGHKTGFYIDQRENRLLAAGLARRFLEENGRGMRVLNCFCYTGGFSLALAAGGAAEVIGIDSSAEAIALARHNAQLNAAESVARFVEDDVFAYLKRARDEGQSFDLVILDPPKFASSHRQVERAARAYKDINLRALRIIAPGGQLLSFSCSGAIDGDLFQKIVASAVIDSGRDAWMVSRLGAGEDHPLMMTCPEGEYLKGVLLKVL